MKKTNKSTRTHQGEKKRFDWEKNLGKKRNGVVTLTSNILLKKVTDEKELNSEKRISEF